eukprot:6402086-Prymnesium_polylepis.1
MYALKVVGRQPSFCAFLLRCPTSVPVSASPGPSSQCSQLSWFRRRDSPPRRGCPRRWPCPRC